MIFDSAGGGKTADRLRGEGYPVIGASVFADSLELDRSLALGLMEEAGIQVPPSQHFTDWQEGVQYVESRGERMCFKSDNNKLTSYVSSCPEDMVEFLRHQQAENEPADFELQDFVKGLEISTELWFDGFDYARPLNHTFERKQLMNDDLGPSSGCYSADTEILTRDGWRFYGDLSPGQQVLTLNDRGEAEYQSIEKIVMYRWNEPLCRFSNSRLDLLVTPDHRMLLKVRGAKQQPFRIKYARDIMSAQDSRYSLPKTSTWKGEQKEFFTLPAYENRWRAGQGSVHKVKLPEIQIPMKVWMGFLGLYLAEGCLKKRKRGDQLIGVEIAQKKNDLEMGALIKALPFTSCRTKKGWEITSIQLAAYIDSLRLGYSWKKFVPREFMVLDKQYLNEMLRFLIKGDGYSYPKSKQRRYYSSSPRLANDVQELFQKTGTDASIRIRDRRGKPVKCSSPGITRHLSYEVSECASETSVYLRKMVREYVPYNGIVWCVTVPNGTVYVRRKGQAVWCGNCAGNIVWACTEEHCLICEQGIKRFVPMLRHHGYRGMLDLNAIVNERGVWGLEWTPRTGFDAFPSLMEMLTIGVGDVLAKYARGERVREFPMTVKGFGGGIRLTIPPYPTDDIDSPFGVAIRGLLRGDRSHSYFYNVFLDKEGQLRSSGGYGAIAVFTGFGDTIYSAMEKCREIADRCEIKDRQFRTDLDRQFDKRYGEYLMLARCEDPLNSAAAASQITA